MRVELTKRCKVSQICSIYDNRTTLSKIWMYNGTEALLSALETPTEIVLERLYKSELQNSVQLQIVSLLCQISKQWTAESHKIEDISKTSA